MLERMIAGVYDENKDLVTKSWDELVAKKIPAVYPPRHHRFLQIQKERFKRLRYDPSIPIPWVKGRNLVTHQEVLIPRRVTQWFIANGERSDVFVHATTNGSAGYFTRTGAVLRGLLEVVQRDGLLVHWLTMIAPEVIRTETLPTDLLKRVQKLEAYGLSIHILNVTSLSIPSVIIAILNSHSGFASQVTLSGASDTVFHDAIDNALREIIIGSEMFYYPEEGTETGLEKTEPEPFVSRFGKAERQLYWRGAERMEKFKWFISGERVSYQYLCQKYDAPELTSDKKRLRWCIDRLKGLGSDYCPVVYFPKNSIQQELGFYIAQVFVPKAFPLYLVEYLGTFDSDRLDEFARSKRISGWTLNPLPHMFS
jgi:ribosomal protein S12 methylthiotransferase accessory factor